MWLSGLTDFMCYQKHIDYIFYGEKTRCSSIRYRKIEKKMEASPNAESSR